MYFVLLVLPRWPPAAYGTCHAQLDMASGALALAHWHQHQHWHTRTVPQALALSPGGFR